MSYVKVCNLEDVGEGEWAAFTVAEQEVLVVWPEDGELTAYQGLCPHQATPLKLGQFDGKLITCSSHQWVFDANSGAAVHPRGCKLAVYPVRIEQNQIQVDL